MPKLRDPETGEIIHLPYPEDEVGADPGLRGVAEPQTEPSEEELMQLIALLQQIGG